MGRFPRFKIWDTTSVFDCHGPNPRCSHSPNFLFSLGPVCSSRCPSGEARFWLEKPSEVFFKLHQGHSKLKIGVQMNDCRPANCGSWPNLAHGLLCVCILDLPQAGLDQVPDLLRLSVCPLNIVQVSRCGQINPTLESVGHPPSRSDQRSSRSPCPSASPTRDLDHDADGGINRPSQDHRLQQSDIPDLSRPR
jgi:hypothetical protein